MRTALVATAWFARHHTISTNWWIRKDDFVATRHRPLHRSALRIALMRRYHACGEMAHRAPQFFRRSARERREQPVYASFTGIFRKNATASARSREQDRVKARCCSHAKAQTWSRKSLCSTRGSSIRTGTDLSWHHYDHFNSHLDLLRRCRVNRFAPRGSV